MAHVPRLYLPDCRGAGAIALSAEQSRRLSEVMRVRVGEAVLVFAGDGFEWQASVTSVARNAVTVEVGEAVREEAPPAPRIELCFPLIRAGRLDWLIEKAVEAGADIFQPTSFEHSAHGEAPSANRSERWQRIAIEAAEQSGRLFVPAFRDVTAFTDVLGRAGTVVVADRSGESWEPFGPQLLVANVRLAVGPEGGLSEGEVAAARSAGATIVSLGPNILRAETAAVVAIALIRALPPQ